MESEINRLLSKLYFCRELLRRSGARVLEYHLYTPGLCAGDSWHFINRSEFGKKSNSWCARAMHLAETNSIPKFVSKVASLFDLFFIKANILTVGGNTNDAE